MTVARTPPLTVSCPESDCGNNMQTCKPWLGPQRHSVGRWENEHVKKCSHLRLPFSIGLIVCSADIAFPHFLGFLTTFLFYPSLNDRGELLTLEYVLERGGQFLWPLLNTKGHLLALLYSFLFSSRGLCYF